MKKGHQLIAKKDKFKNNDYALAIALIQLNILNLEEELTEKNVKSVQLKSLNELCKRKMKEATSKTYFEKPQTVMLVTPPIFKKHKKTSIFCRSKH